eukprot:351205-Chlamydomonas_euryale.AAC.2
MCGAWRCLDELHVWGVALPGRVAAPSPTKHPVGVAASPASPSGGVQASQALRALLVVCDAVETQAALWQAHDVKAGNGPTTCTTAPLRHDSTIFTGGLQLGAPKRTWCTRAADGVERRGSTPGPRQGSTPGPHQGSTPGPHQGSTPGPHQGSTPGPHQGSTPGPHQGSTPGPHQGFTQGFHTRDPHRDHTRDPHLEQTRDSHRVSTPGIHTGVPQRARTVPQVSPPGVHVPLLKQALSAFVRGQAREDCSGALAFQRPSMRLCGWEAASHPAKQPGCPHPTLPAVLQATLAATPGTKTSC